MLQCCIEVSPGLVIHLTTSSFLGMIMIATLFPLTSLFRCACTLICVFYLHVASVCNLSLFALYRLWASEWVSLDYPPK